MKHDTFDDTSEIKSTETIISLIAVVDQQSGLGKNNGLLCYLPADLRRFKQITLGKPIIMGRKTYESIGKPLPNRKNIIVSRQALNIPSVTVCSSIEEALNKALPTEEIMVIGGSEIFKLAMPLADKIYLTRIDHTFDADVFFPKMNEDWQCISEGFHPADKENLYALWFCEYRRKKPS